MPRIPPEELESLKKTVDLAALVRAKGVELKPHGKDLIGLCPFHNDREPSLVVTPSKNLWHCLGACQTGGDAIGWVQRAEGVSFRHAVELLRDGRASRIVTSGKVLNHSTVSRLPSPVDPSADDETVLKQVIEYYHERLKASPQALDYLEKRGIRNEEAIERFKLGFADRTLGLRLPQKNRLEGAQIRKKLTRIGIYRESGHEHLSGSVVIPIMDGSGRVTEVYGRKINDNLRPGTPYHLYLPGPHRGVWNPEALKAEEVILCEALIDALTFWVNGLRNVTASYGVEGFTPEHLAGLLDHRVKRLFIAYDRDEAGERAAEKLAGKLSSEGIGCYRVQFPLGMDANAFAVEKGSGAPEALGRLVQSAVWMGEKGAGSQGPVLRDQSPQLRTPDGQSPILPLAAPPDPRSLTPDSRSLTPVARNGDDIRIGFGEREYRIRGLAKNLSFEAMKVNVRVSVGERYHIDTLDLLSARHRSAFIAAAAEETGIEPDVIKRDMGRVLLKLEELQEALVSETLTPRKKEAVLTDRERVEALDLLRDPGLLDRIVADFERCGLVGERTNVTVGYLAAVSRKLEDPLAVIIQSSSAAGKSSLMDAILGFVPEEDRVKYTAMTGQSLFYMEQNELAHKTLAISEGEGAERASYAIKTIQSEKSLRIASTGKDPKTGRLVTHEYEVTGPVQIMLTTTAVEIDEELQNRCLVLTVNEDREQTRAIHRLQREAETLEGMLSKREREQVVKLHRNAQRLLKPVTVVNPYATRLTFLDNRLRARRDHLKYLGLIRSVCLLCQYQRPSKTVDHRGQPVEYIEATLGDIEAANRLSSEVLGRTLDELSPQTRRLLMMIDQMVSEATKRLSMERSDYRFSRREVRAYTGWTDFQVRMHLRKLEDLEYVLLHRGSRGQSFVYELLYRGEGQDGSPFLMGLIEAVELRRAYDEKAEHQKPGFEHRKTGGKDLASIQSAPNEHAGTAFAPRSTFRQWLQNAYRGKGFLAFVIRTAKS